MGTNLNVSFVVPVWREEVYAEVCKPWLQKQVEWYGSEIVEIRNSKSIFHALERGRRKAKNRFIFYVHDDVRLVAPSDIVPNIVRTFERFKDLGLIGPVGKVKQEVVPWWDNPGRYVGHYLRRGQNRELIYQYTDGNGATQFKEYVPRWNLDWDTFAEAGVVDGFFLCEDRERIKKPWDLKSFGQNWHGYDMDRCFQTHALGYKVMVTPWLFLHDNAGHAGYKGTDPRKLNQKDNKRRRVNSVGDRLWLSDLDKANEVLRTKWGLKQCAS